MSKVKSYVGRIGLKGGIIKGYNFETFFIESNKKLVNDFADLFDEIYKNDCCVYGASETHKNNDILKNKICNMLDIMFDKNVDIYNDFDNKHYTNKKEYHKYILNYGKDNE